MLGYIHTADRGVPNAVLAEVAATLTAAGVSLTGLVQDRAPGDGAHPCDMDLRCLPDGPVFPIAQKLGRGSRGCRMDIDALETGVAYVEAQITPDTGAFILNKFGAQEAQGRGFTSAIAKALDAGVPVITVVNPQNIDAFRAIAGDMAEELPPNADAIIGWIRAHRSGAAA